MAYGRTNIAIGQTNVLAKQEKWVKKTWLGIPNINGNGVFNASGDCYFCERGVGQFRLSGGDTWVSHDLGFGVSNGFDVWYRSSEDKTYYSDISNEQKIFNAQYQTFNDWYWEGYTEISGRFVWKYNDYYCYSWGNGDQYTLLDGSNEWVKSDMWDDDNLYGDDIWKKDNQYFYSRYDKDTSTNLQYFLDAWTWKNKSWGGFTRIIGKNIWNWKNHWYYSNGVNEQYELKNDTWVKKSWRGFSNIIGAHIWKWRGHCYYSYNTEQWELKE